MRILTLLEKRGELKRCGLEAASAAARLARSAGGEVDALYLGPPLGEGMGQLAGLGIRRLHAFEGEKLIHITPDRHARLVRDIAREIEADLIVGPASALGKSLCASAAALLDAELVQDAVGLEWADGIRVRKPLYAGRIMADLRITGRPAMVSLRPNVFPVERIDAVLPEIVRRLPPDLPLRTVVREVVQAAGGVLDLTEAKTVVAGGRGIGGPQNWPILEKLCAELGGALGASRAAVDAGWIHPSHQVGQTGRVVSPDLYIACGISGAIQHLAGIRGARVVVAVNKDPEAEIFRFCDFGIVGDLFEVVPLLTEELRVHRPAA